MVSTQEDGFQKNKKEGLESLHVILQHAQTMCSLIAPGNWPEDANSIVSESDPADLRAPRITSLSDTQGPRSKAVSGSHSQSRS